jgi:hypothetical protein
VFENWKLELKSLVQVQAIQLIIAKMLRNIWNDSNICKCAILYKDIIH